MQLEHRSSIVLLGLRNEGLNNDDPPVDRLLVLLVLHLHTYVHMHACIQQYSFKELVPHNIHFTEYWGTNFYAFHGYITSHESNCLVKIYMYSIHKNKYPGL